MSATSTRRPASGRIAVHPVKTRYAASAPLATAVLRSYTEMPTAVSPIAIIATTKTWPERRCHAAPLRVAMAMHPATSATVPAVA